jgi:hypothetical protein
MKKIIFLSSLFFLLLSCKEKNKFGINQDMLEYDQSLATIQSVKILSPKKINCSKLDNRLNLKFLEDKKTKMDKIVFNDHSLLPIFWDSSYLKNSLAGYCYGVKSILGNNLYFYTEDFKNENERFEENQYHQVGLLLIERNGYFVTWVKIYETDIDSEKFLESFLFDNYIICVETTNPAYDVVYEGSEKLKKYKYVVFKISKDGNVLRLNKIESNKILFRYM